MARLVSLLLLLGAAMADVNSIKGALDTVNAGLLALDTAVLGLPQTMNDLVKLGPQAVPLLANATQIIKDSDVLGLQDALTLIPATTALRQNGNLTINDFIARKPIFDAVGLTPRVVQAMTNDGAAAAALGQALVSKVPDMSSIPGVQYQTFTALSELATMFQRGLEIFSEGNATVTGVGMAPAAAAPTAAATGTAAPAPVQGMGTANADGSCGCAVVCPAGSMGNMGEVMQMSGAMGGAGGLQMLGGNNNAQPGTMPLKPLGGS